MYTLAQSGTNDFETTTKNTGIILSGEGSDLNNDKALKARAKRKTISNSMLLNMVDFADKKKDRKQSYWNGWHCQNTLITANGRIHTTYCKNRFCLVCSAIRKAYIINSYLPVIRSWPDPHFVTLTVKSAPKKHLKKALEAVLRVFQIIKNRHRKRHQRKQGSLLMGIKSLECNYNPTSKEYNPHLHIIVPDKQTAVLLVAEWLKQWSKAKGKASPKAQHIRRIDKAENALIETVKYGSKIFTEPDVRKKTKAEKPQDRTLYTKALFNIFEAMQGLRIFERFGFNLAKKAPQQRHITKIEYYQTWVLDYKQCDWINIITGRALAKYLPDDMLLDLLNNRSDSFSE